MIKIWVLGVVPALETIRVLQFCPTCLCPPPLHLKYRPRGFENLSQLPLPQTLMSALAPLLPIRNATIRIQALGNCKIAPISKHSPKSAMRRLPSGVFLLQLSSQGCQSQEAFPKAALKPVPKGLWKPSKVSDRPHGPLNSRKKKHLKVSDAQWGQLCHSPRCVNLGEWHNCPCHPALLRICHMLLTFSSFSFAVERPLQFTQCFRRLLKLH